ncbi:hypothetical protein PG984_007316 [Apiospora sp. TS-2023a]
MKLKGSDLPSRLIGRRRVVKVSGGSFTLTDCPVAVRVVFSTFELLDAILAHFEMRELLHLQRVSVAFKEVIQNSTPLQQKLHFLPVAHETKPGTGQRIWGNPMLKQAFVQLFTCMFIEYPASFRLHQTGLRSMVAMLEATKLPSIEAFNRRGASWRSMLISQPPPVRLSYLSKVAGRDYQETLISRDQPVRIGPVYDLAYYALWRTGAYFVHWKLHEQILDEHGQPLLHEIFGDHLEGTPGATRVLSICVEEDEGCTSSAPVPYPSHFFSRWNKGALSRLERLVYKTSKSVRTELRCQYLEPEDYDRDAVVKAVQNRGREDSGCCHSPLTDGATC